MLLHVTIVVSEQSKKLIDEERKAKIESPYPLWINLSQARWVGMHEDYARISMPGGSGGITYEITFPEELERLQRFLEAQQSTLS